MYECIFSLLIDEIMLIYRKVDGSEHQVIGNHPPRIGAKAYFRGKMIVVGEDLPETERIQFENEVKTWEEIQEIVLNRLRYL